MVAYPFQTHGKSDPPGTHLTYNIGSHTIHRTPLKHVIAWHSFLRSEEKQNKIIAGTPHDHTGITEASSKGVQRCPHAITCNICSLEFENKKELQPQKEGGTRSA
jgi:hypothetical protein